jgi:tripartite motif-containing protein 71
VHFRQSGASSWSPWLALVALIAALGVAPPATARAEGYHFLRQWGSRGAGDGQFKSPQGVAVDATGNVYVVDQDSDRIQKFTREGAFVAKWGSEGTGPGQFDYPCAIAVDTAGRVYVADEENCRIQVFSGEGVFLRQFGSRGTGPGQFTYEDDMGGGLSGLAVDREGNVYATDTLLHRVQKFSSEGRFVTAWGSEGDEPGQFQTPRSVAVDAQGQVYVADEFNYRVQKFTSAGAYVAHWGKQGYGRGQLTGPHGIAVDAAGNVYVTDTNALDFIQGDADEILPRVLKFAGTGGFLAQWGQYGEEPGQFGLPAGLAVAKDGAVYVADSGNDRILVFARD